MNKRPNLFTYIFSFITALVCFICPLAASAADLSVPGSLTLVCVSDGVSLSGMEWSIFRVGTHSPYGEFYLDGDFADYPVTFDDLSVSAMTSAAETLEMYTKTDSISPLATLATDAGGKAVFENLELGIYLLSGSSVQVEGSIYTPNAFLVEIADDSDEVYNMTSYPKFSVEEIPGYGESEYSIEKIWRNDEGYSVRPDSVTIEIYADSVLYDTVVLDESNNWSYAWTGKVECEWSVKEINIDKDYTVAYTSAGKAFSIVNSMTASTVTTVTTTGTTTPPNQDIPQTGLLWWPVPVLAFAGIVLVVIGIKVGAKEKE